MACFQGEYSCRSTDSVRRFIVGRVLVLNIIGHQYISLPPGPLLVLELDVRADGPDGRLGELARALLQLLSQIRHAAPKLREQVAVVRRRRADVLRRLRVGDASWKDVSDTFALKEVRVGDASQIGVSDRMRWLTRWDAPVRLKRRCELEGC